MTSFRNRSPSPRLFARLAVAALAVVVAGTAMVVLARRPGDAAATRSPWMATSADVALASANTPSSGWESATPALSAAPSPAPFDTAADPTSQATSTQAPTKAAPTPKATPRPTPTAVSTAHGWQPSAALSAAKAQGRVVVDAGVVSVLPSPPTPATYPRALTLEIAWTGLMQEPPPSGVDDAGKSYRDDNYALLCGPGTAAVVLYYWTAAHTAVMTKSGSFTEPVNVGTNRHATTTWAASSGSGNGRGMIMYLAEDEWPSPDRGQPWWKAPGLMTWSARPPSTDIWNLADAINWEASGGRSVAYFYSIVSASDLTQAALLNHVHADIAAGVPVVIAARTSNGSVSLPYWRVTSTRNAANHFITVVGYDDDAGTYTTIDTCGKGCNTTGARSGVGRIGQAALHALIRAESDNDGIIW